MQHFGHGREALSEAGKKGAEISTKMRTEEQRKEAARKARAQPPCRLGTQHVSKQWEPAVHASLSIGTPHALQTHVAMAYLLVDR